MTTTVVFTDAPFSAPTDGSSDCSTAVAALNTYLDTHSDVLLKVPAHRYNITASSSLGLGNNGGVAGGNRLVIDAQGAEFAVLSGGAAWSIGGRGESPTASPQATCRIATASAGASTLQLIVFADADLLTAGAMIRVAGWDMQGAGQPTNPFVFEYVRISAKSALTGLVTLASPLRHSYSAAWPLFDDGTGLEPDEGGPATIYILNSAFDIDLRIYGGTFSHNANNQISAIGRKILLDHVTCTSTNGIIPSQNDEHIWKGCDFSLCGVECDKSVYLFDAGNGTTVSQLGFQSASVRTWRSRGGLTITNSVSGTPKIVDIEDVTVQGSGGIGFGPFGNGRTDLIRVKNCVIPHTGNAGALIHLDTLGFVITAAGLITVPFVPGPGVFNHPNWATPDGRIVLWRDTPGGRSAEGMCDILSVTLDATNFYVTTTPIPSFVAAAPYGIMAHPCACPVIESSTGCPTIVDLSQAGAYGQPLYSYSKRTYSGAASGSTLRLYSSDPAIAEQYSLMWGDFVRAVITVTQAYTGSGSLLLNVFGSGVFINAAGTDPSYDLVVDLKQAAPRTITVTTSGVTGSAGSDSLSSGSGKYFSKAFLPLVSQDISGKPSGEWPIVTIELFSDQGFAAQSAKSVAFG